MMGSAEIWEKCSSLCTEPLSSIVVHSSVIGAAGIRMGANKLSDSICYYCPDRVVKMALWSTLDLYINYELYISISYISNISISILSQNQRKEAFNLHASEIWGFHRGRLWCIHSDPEITTENSWKRFACEIWMIQRDSRKMMLVCKRSVIGLKWQLDCIMLSLQNSLALPSLWGTVWTSDTSSHAKSQGNSYNGKMLQEAAESWR